MNTNMLNFNINNDEQMIIKLNDPQDIIHCCYQTPIFLHAYNDEFIIGNSTISDYAERLQNRLNSVLSNQLKLHSSITKDIGYYWNQRLNEEKPDIVYIEGIDGKYWRGLKYFLWSTASKSKLKFGVWIYNDAIGNIIFEVTPLFSGTLVDWDDPIEMKEYQDWMATSYKPFFTRIISKEVAMQWLDQANLILKDIHDKIKKSN